MIAAACLAIPGIKLLSVTAPEDQNTAYDANNRQHSAQTDIFKIEVLYLAELGSYR